MHQTKNYNDALRSAIQFKIDVPKHLQKKISVDHFNDIKNNVQLLINILRTHKVNVETTRIDLLDDNHVGYWYEYITNHYGEGSYSTKLKIIKSFINHMIDHVGVKMRNPFKKVRFKTIEYDTSSITRNEFLAVLDAVKNKSPHEQA